MPIISDLQLTITPSAALYQENIPDSQLSVNESVTQGRHAIIIDFNDSEGLYTRDLGTIFQWPTKAFTILNIWQPSVALMDDDIYYRLSYHFLMRSLWGKGWGHLREMNVAFSSSTDLTLLLNFDATASPSSLTLTVPNSGGQTTKVKVVLPPNKFKMMEGWISSSQPFLLWGNDLEMKVKEWGFTGAYQIVRPFQG